jgi:glycogen operon protein
VKNFLALTLLSVGAAMVLMGDEVRRTQRGNNNAYCQDNEISWFDWTGLEKHAEIHRFTRLLLRLRSTRDLTRKEGDLTLNEILGHARISWHGVKLNQPDWSEESHCLALTFNSLEGRFLVHVILNAYWESLTFELPPIEGSSHEGWHRAIDTALAPPDDISEGPEEAPQVPDRNYLTQPRSVVLLFALRSMEEL